MNRLLDLASDFGLEVDDRTIGVLRELYFDIRPRSNKFHHTQPGDLMRHSLEVALYLTEATRHMNLVWQRDMLKFNPMFSPFYIGLFHDLCAVATHDYKTGKRIPGVEGHGDLSVRLVEDLFPWIELNEEEKVCIENHMGVYGLDREGMDRYNDLCKQYPNLLYTHLADMMSACEKINLKYRI